MTNEERIDNCVTDLIETVPTRIKILSAKDAMKSSDEIIALAELIKARATIRPIPAAPPEEPHRE